MGLTSGSRIGPYEIVALLGAGGMGEVYRARDARLGRDVAIKVLAATFTGEPDWLRRFEQEAKATAALNDPNIVAVYDVGTFEGQPYVVSELLDGETLRSAIAAGPLPSRKAAAYGKQIAHGMAAAHRRGIIHRDLKPENIFVTRDGVVKILDFGIAKLSEGVDHSLSAKTTAPGVVLGTVGYMSPEQAKGEPADHRSDIFSFGALLYEMFAGQRAFQGNSSIETLSAIVKEHPPDLAQLAPGVPPVLARIVERCLEKNSEDRFQNAADLGFALDSHSGASAPAEPLPRTGHGSWRAVAAVLAAALLLAGAFGVWSRFGRQDPPRFHQLTFRRGTVQSARFAPDGQTVIYAAAWEGAPAELFSTRPEAPEARPLQMPDMGLFAISSKGDMAIALHPNGFGRVQGTLARAALAGGPPRQMAERVLAADWTPDGSALAMVQNRGGTNVLEFPLGHQLYEPSPGHITHIRISPSGDAIAVILHPVDGDTAGSVVLVDMEGRARTLTEGWNSILGLSWAPGGNEIWFTGTRAGASQAIHAVTRTGSERLLLATPATLTLHDVSRDGRALVSRDSWGSGVIALGPSSERERDLSWLDGSMAMDISADGRTMVLEESWQGGGAARSIYLRTMDGAPAVRLGEGVPLALSPDKQWVISTPVAGDQLVLLPTGIGQPRTLPRGKITSYQTSARWLPDGRRFLVSASETDRKGRVYLQSIDSGDPQPVTSEGVYGRIAVFPDGEHFITRDTSRRLAVYALDGGASRPVAGAQPRDVALAVSADGQSLYVQGDQASLPAEVIRLNLVTGKREKLRSLLPPDPAGVTDILEVALTPDGRSYAYSFVRALSSLYLVDGLR